MRIKDELGNSVVVPIKYRKKIKQLIELGDNEGVSLLVKQFGGNVNTTGYTPGTFTYGNPYNIIPGGNITMENTPFPVMGFPLDGNQNVGNPVLMKPGENYEFPNAAGVLEVPAMQYGRLSYEIPNTEFNMLRSVVRDVQPQQYYGRYEVPPTVGGPYSIPEMGGVECPPYHVWDEASQSCVPERIGTPRQETATQDPNIDELLGKYTQYLDRADEFNEQNYPTAQEDYRNLLRDLRGYSAVQAGSAALGIIGQNPYTQPAFVDQGFAEAARKSSMMPQYLLDSQRAEAEGQMSRVANTLISQGAKPAEVASMMAPYYADLQKTQNQLAIQRFQANAAANRDYYSFLTEIGNKNRIEDIENRNRILSDQNKQIARLADVGTDYSKNLADLRASETELQRSADREYQTNLFRNAMARLGVAGPEIEYRLHEQRLRGMDDWLDRAGVFIKGNPAARTAIEEERANDPALNSPIQSLTPRPIKPVQRQGMPELPQTMWTPPPLPYQSMPEGMGRGFIESRPAPVVPGPVVPETPSVPARSFSVTDSSPTVNEPIIAPIQSVPYERGFRVEDTRIPSRVANPQPTPVPYDRGFRVTDDAYRGTPKPAPQRPIPNEALLWNLPAHVPQISRESTNLPLPLPDLGPIPGVWEMYAKPSKNSPEGFYNTLEMARDYHPNPIVRGIASRRKLPKQLAKKMIFRDLYGNVVWQPGKHPESIIDDIYEYLQSLGYE